MTALCGGGSSSPRSGVSPAIILTGTAIEAFLTPLIDPIAATLIAGVISASLVVDTNDYCAHDPPSDPGIVAQDLVDLVNYGDPAAMYAATQKFQQWFGSRYWYQICECDSVATPAPPTLSNPGPASNNPGLPSGGNTDPCWNAGPVDATCTGSSSPIGDALTAPSANLLPPGTPIHWTNGSLSGFAYPIPAGANNVHWSTSIGQLLTSSSGLVSPSVMWFSNAGTLLGNSGMGNYTNAGATTASGQFVTIPFSATYWAIALGSSAVGEQSTVTFHWSFFCSGQAPTGVATACCPPDPLLEGLLSQILGLVTGIYRSLPVPLTSYSVGASHTALSGSGEIATVANVLALKVTLTTIPSALGVEIEDPLFHFDVGWITPEIVATPYQSTRITFAEQHVNLPQLVDSFHYSLHPGVVATVDELTRGP